MTAQETITKARVKLLIDNPFFGSLLLHLEPKEDPTCPTAWTDGKVLGYNPKFVLGLPPAELVGLLAHEVMHPALLHHTRRQGRDPLKWNIAADYCINAILTESGFTIPKGGLLDSRYAGKSSEAVYAELPENPQPRGGNWNFGEVRDGQKKGGGKGQQGSGEGGKKNAPAGPGEASEGQPDGDGELDEESLWKVRLTQAASAARRAGKVSAGIARLVEEVLNPQLPWQTILRRFLQGQAKDDFSWRRPNRRYAAYDIYLPSMHSEAYGKIVVGIDASGSISGRQLAQFGGELSAIVAELKAETTVIYHDYSVTNVEVFAPDTPIKLNPKGGGGTRFTPVFDYIREKNIRPAALLFFTDLECSDYPDVPPSYPTLWIVSNRYRKDYDKPPFGECIRMQE